MSDLIEELEKLCILLQLLDKLDGECGNACPIVLNRKQNKVVWDCSDCRKAFGYLGATLFTCPCQAAPGYAVLALEEEIEIRMSNLSSFAEGQLIVLKMLQAKLKGKCSRDLCPKKISNELFPKKQVWRCLDCTITFKYLQRRKTSLIGPCPCRMAPGYACLALEQEIEQREEKLLNEKNV